MADTATRHSPLAHAAGRFASATRGSGGDLRLAELPFL
ncbi:sarcosine oxidase subunit gamma, partial [Streptomyces lunaelactis]|nr:sarcosine oxidase subunit gamma [Streptomyces lunaelactis]